MRTLLCVTLLLVFFLFLFMGCTTSPPVESTLMSSIDVTFSEPSENLDGGFVLNKIYATGGAGSVAADITLTTTNVAVPGDELLVLLPDEVEYISGDLLSGDEGLNPPNNLYYIELTGKPGHNASGEYLGVDKENSIMQIEDTQIKFKVKIKTSGVHQIHINAFRPQHSPKPRPDGLITIKAATTLEEARVLTEIENNPCPGGQCEAEQI